MNDDFERIAALRALCLQAQSKGHWIAYDRYADQEQLWETPEAVLARLDAGDLTAPHQHIGFPKWKAGAGCYLIVDPAERLRLLRCDMQAAVKRHRELRDRLFDEAMKRVEAQHA